MPVQKENDQLTDFMGAHFFRRDDGALSLAHLPGLLKLFPGYYSSWFGSNVDQNGDVRNDNGSDNPMTTVNPGTRYFGRDTRIPFMDMGNTCYLTTLQSYIVTGLETYIQASLLGLTMFGFIRTPNIATGANQRVFGRYQRSTNQRSYTINITPTGFIQFIVSIDGIAITSVFSASGYSNNQWLFIAARWKPGTEMMLQVNNDRFYNVAAIPASLFDPVGIGFSIAADFNGNDHSNNLQWGWIGLYRNALPDDCIQAARTLSFSAFRS